MCEDGDLWVAGSLMWCVYMSEYDCMNEPVNVQYGLFFYAFVCPESETLSQGTGCST